MRSIESTKDLVEWAKEVNYGVSLSRKCDLQDVYGRSYQAEIDQAFLDCGAARKLVICSVTNTMAFDEVERLLSVLARHKAQAAVEKELALLETQWEKLSRAMHAFDLSKKKVYAKIKGLTSRVDYFSDRMVHFRGLYKEEKAKSSLYKSDSRRYRRIKELLS